MQPGEILQNYFHNIQDYNLSPQIISKGSGHVLNDPFLSSSFLLWFAHAPTSYLNASLISAMFI
jgi:hypothetical protein